MKKINNKEAKEIGDNLSLDWNKIDLNEFTKGINVEFEHGSRYSETNITNDDKNLTAKIAWAHLKEFPDYYTRLAKMETEAETYWNKKEM